MVLLFLSAFLIFQTATPDTIKVESEVGSATVFLSGAEVNRSASVKLQPGTNNIAFIGLSPSLDGNTIQLQTNAEIILESLSNFRNRDYQGEQAAQIETLESRKTEIEENIKQTKASVTVLDRKLNVLLNNQDVSGENTKISATELRQAVDYFEEQFQLIEERRLELQAELQQLNEQLQQINHKIQELKNQQARAAEVIEMTVHSETAQTATFNLSYVVPPARWYPSYDIRVPDAGEPLTLTYKANITQRSGIDWENVNLTVSSAQPQRETNIPTIDPIFLQFYEQPQHRLSLSSELALDNLKTAGELGISSVWGVVRNPNGEPIPSANVYVPETQQGAATDQNGRFLLNLKSQAKVLRVSFVGYQTKVVPISSSNMNIVLEEGDVGLNEMVVTSYDSPIQAQLQEGQTAFSFKIENPYTIETGAATKTIAVESSTLPAEYEYLTIPKKQTAAYLTAKVTNWESLNLLPGEANLFLSQSYVGDTRLNANTSQDTLSFSLGRDEGIIVERSPIESFEEKNFFGNRLTETKGWEITIRNTKYRSVSINITDQVPVSTNEDIDVELTESTGAEFNESTGKLNWHLTLSPSEARTLRFVYEITYPSGKQIEQRGNR